MRMRDPSTRLVRFVLSVLVVALGLAPAAEAQSELRWAVTRDVGQLGTSDESWSMVVDHAAERVYVCGWYFVTSPPQIYTGFVTAYDLSGTHLWTRSLPGTTPRSTFFYRLAVHPAGGVVAIGEEGELGQFDSNVLVARIDALGAVAWSTTWDGPAQLADSGNEVVLDVLGNATVTASTWSPPAIGMTSVVLRYDTLGNLIGTPLLPDPNEQAGSANLAVLPGGDVIVASPASLRRVTQGLVVAWTVTSTTTSFGPVVTAPNGDIYVATSTPGTSGNSAFQVSSYDAGGLWRWTQSVADALHTSGGAGRLVVHPSGLVMAAGFFGSDVCAPTFLQDGVVVAFDANGVEQWRRFGAFDGTPMSEFVQMRSAANGDLVLQGISRDPQGVAAMQVTRVGADGSPRWTVQPIPAGSFGAMCVGVDSVDTDAVIAVSSVTNGPFGFSSPADQFVTRIDSTKPSFCHGDGSALACPCGNAGAVGHGCASSVAPVGGLLRGVGRSRLAVDELELTATSVPNGPGLYFQASGASDVTFGDGKLCASSGILRLAVVFASGNTSTLPDPANPTPLHVAGLVGPGDVRHYQVWYRDADLGFCTPQLFNLTNAVTAEWAP